MLISRHVKLYGHFTARLNWFPFAVAAIFILSLLIRLWGLSRFNELVFDEVYYVKYANSYLNHQPFFDVHPPLGKYLIAFGIWFTSLNPWGYSSLTQLPDFQLATFSYRWFNALTGALIPVIVAYLSYQLSCRRTYALIAGCLTALDGLLLVESRYGLINIYLLIFGLLGQLFFLLAIKHKTGQQNFWLLLAGICFGASVSVKWTGLGFLLSIYLLWLGANFFEWFLKLPLLRLAISQVDQSTGNASQSQSNDLLRQWTVIRPWQFTLNLAIIPAIVYRLLWIPHLQINQDFNFWEMHKQILGYHSNLGSGPNEHPYCSLWYSWPLMLRPIGYFYKTLENQVAKSTTIYDVHAMGNPALWWFSTFAVLSLMGLVIWRTWITASFTLNARSLPALSISQKMGITVSVFILAGYLSNLLPWIKVTRCAFIYHYMGSSLFSFMALAWLLDQAFRSSKVWQEVLAGMILFLIAWAFVYWLPVYVGLPLSSAEFQSRMWLESWY